MAENADPKSGLDPAAKRFVPKTFISSGKKDPI